MRIIYKNTDNTLAILIPAEKVLATVGIQAIAEKDVPQDLPYWFANDDDIPSERSTGEPDGFGGQSNEFTDEQLLTLYQQGVIGIEKIKGT